MTQLATHPQDTPTWDAVLAEVEADVARTEDLLRSVTTPSGEIRLGPLSPAETMLPSGTGAAAGPMLPDPALMPQVPVELLGRIGALRERIAEISDELVTALNDVSTYLSAPSAPDLSAVSPRPAPAPRFVDRAL